MFWRNTESFLYSCGLKKDLISAEDFNFRLSSSMNSKSQYRSNDIAVLKVDYFIFRKRKREGAGDVKKR